jgi:hypothetical protein
MDMVVLMRGQIAGLRADLAEWEWRSAELADEVARLGANDSRMITELD